jgi:hypothetical protein
MLDVENVDDEHEDYCCVVVYSILLAPSLITGCVNSPRPQKGEGLPSVRLSMCPFFPSGNFLQRFLSARRADPALDAAKKAGVKRFVPCARITVCPTGGAMRIRNQVCTSF